MIRIDKIRGETVSLDNATGTLIAYCTSLLFQPWYMQLAQTLCDGFQIKCRTKAGLRTISSRPSDYLFMPHNIFKGETKGTSNIHSLGSRCFTKKSAFNVTKNLVAVVKFTF